MKTKTTADIDGRDDWTEDEFDAGRPAGLDDEILDLAEGEPELPVEAVLSDDDVDDSDYDDGSDDDEIDDLKCMAVLDRLDLDWDAPTDAHPGMDIALVLGGDDAQDDDLAA